MPELSQCGETRIHPPHAWTSTDNQTHTCAGLDGSEPFYVQPGTSNW